MEVVLDGGGRLSIILIGHPKLHNDLKGPRMEQVGYRTLTVSLDSMQGELREYIFWLVNTVADDTATVTRALFKLMGEFEIGGIPSIPLLQRTPPRPSARAP